MGFEEYGLDNIHCKVCGDVGYTAWINDEGMLCSKECECMNRRRVLRQLKKSGLDGLIRLYTFDRYQTPDGYTAELKDKAKTYCGTRSTWFYISGKPGSGKTHLCTAICSHFLGAGESVFYSVWPEEVGRIKTLKAGDPPDPQYEKTMERLKTAPVLYIDDLFKGKVTEADLKIAFEILNARYNNPKLRTIISSERDLKQIGDSAIAGRISERANGFVLKAPGRDRRIER